MKSVKHGHEPPITAGRQHEDPARVKGANISGTRTHKKAHKIKDEEGD